MYLTNQQYDIANQQKLDFSPVSSKISNIGTTVMYGTQPSYTINAMNTNLLASGNFNNNQQAGWNQAAYIQAYSHQQPIINAGYGNQYLSGNTAFQQFGQIFLAQPAVDISETTSDVVVAAYLPNVALNDISLSVTENSVTISASAWTGTQNMAFNRTVALPTSIRAESVDASMQSGFLEIRCPKAEKAVRKRNTVSQDTTQQK
jgi:HSP20 family protein